MNIVQPIRDLTDIDAIRNHLLGRSYRDYMLFEIGISLGYRVSDLAPLTAKQVRNKTHIYINQQKTKTGVRLMIRQQIVDKINEYTKIMNDDDYVFPSRKGGSPLSRIQIWRILNEAAKACGIEEVGTHTLRKTFGYHIYKETNNLGLVQMLLGQTSQSATIRYIGIGQDMMDEAIQLLPY